MNKTLILVVSLAANGALIAAYALRTPPPAPAPVVATPAEIVVTNVVVKEIPLAPETVTQTSVVRMNWSNIETADYRAYIANLRGTGCPEETIRDIIIADVNKLYAGKWRTLRMQRAAAWKFWESDVKNAKSNAQNNADRKQLETEREALVKELLGVDLKSELSKYVWETSSRDERYAFLAESKQEALKDIYAKYRAAQTEILTAAKTSGEPKDVTSKKLDELREKRNTDMAAVMTPAENEEYALRTSNLAGRMRTDLAGFEANEQEFRALYKVLSAADNVETANGKKTKPVDFNDPNLQALIREAIGDTRYAEFAKVNDPQAKEVLRLTQRYGLTQEEAGKVSVVSLIAQQELDRVLNDPNLTAQQKSAYKKQVDQEKKRILTETLSAHAKNQKNKQL